MKQFFSILAGLLLPLAASAFVSQIYTTNSAAVVDAHVVSIAGAGSGQPPSGVLTNLANGTGGFTNSGAVSFTNAANSFAGSFNGAIATNMALTGGYTLIWATNYGVQGIVYTNWDPSYSALTPQDTAISNCLAAAQSLSRGNTNPIQPMIILPAGVIKITNTIDVHFPVAIVGVGSTLHNMGWGVGDPTVPYTIIWQSNNQHDGIHLTRTAIGKTLLQNFEICGGATPVTGVGNIGASPIWAQWGVTNAGNTHAKVGLTICDTNATWCGGVDMNDMVICGWKIGLANGGNNEIWNHLQFPGCDLAWWNAGNTNFTQFNGLSDLPLIMNAYGSLIECVLGAPDQIVVNNLSFGSQKGGVGLMLGYGNGIIINNSCGINGPMCWAVLTSGTYLHVLGGHDEPMDNGWGGTNWIYGVGAVRGIKACNWQCDSSFWPTTTNLLGQSASNRCFFYGSAAGGCSVGEIILNSVDGPQNPRFGGMTVWAWGSVSCENRHSTLGGIWQESRYGGNYGNGGYVYDFSQGDGMTHGFFQKTCNNNYPYNISFNLLQEVAGRPFVMKDNPWDSFYGMVENWNMQANYDSSYESVSEGTNFAMVHFLTTDPITWTNWYPGGVVSQSITQTNISVTFSNITSVGTFTGSGSGLTNLQATIIAGGVGVFTNNGMVWAAAITNNTPAIALPNGSICTTTNGQFYVRSNAAWVVK